MLWTKLLELDRSLNISLIIAFTVKSSLTDYSAKNSKWPIVNRLLAVFLFLTLDILPLSEFNPHDLGFNALVANLFIGRSALAAYIVDGGCLQTFHKKYNRAIIHDL